MYMTIYVCVHACIIKRLKKEKEKEKAYDTECFIFFADFENILFHFPTFSNEHRSDWESQL